MLLVWPMKWLLSSRLTLWLFLSLVYMRRHLATIRSSILLISKWCSGITHKTRKCAVKDAYFLFSILLRRNHASCLFRYFYFICCRSSSCVTAFIFWFIIFFFFHCPNALERWYRLRVRANHHQHHAIYFCFSIILLFVLFLVLLLLQFFFFLISNIHIYVHNCLRFDVCNFPLVGWMSNAAGNQTWVRLWLWMCYFSFVDHLFCIQFVFVCSYLTIIFRMAKSGSQCREQLPSLQLGPLELGCWRAQQQEQHKIATAHAAHVCNAFYYLLFRVIQGWRA